MFTCSSCGAGQCNNRFSPCFMFSRPGISVSRACSHGFDDNNCQDIVCCPPPFAYLTQTDAFTIAAGVPVPFTGNALLSGGMSFCNGLLELPAPGVYRVSYTLHIPAGSVVDTTVVIRVGGVDIAGTQQTITSALGGQRFEVTGQAIFEISAPAALGLFSTNAFALTPSFPGDALATLTVENVF